MKKKTWRIEEKSIVIIAITKIIAITAAIIVIAIIIAVVVKLAWYTIT